MEERRHRSQGQPWVGLAAAALSSELWPCAPGITAEQRKGDFGKGVVLWDAWELAVGSSELLSVFRGFCRGIQGWMRLEGTIEGHPVPPSPQNSGLCLADDRDGHDLHCSGGGCEGCEGWTKLGEP